MDKGLVERLIGILLILGRWDSRCDAGVHKAQLSLRIASAVCGAFLQFNKTGVMKEEPLDFVPPGAPSVVGCEEIRWEVCENETTTTAADCSEGLMSLEKCRSASTDEKDGMRQDPWDIHFHFNSSEGVEEDTGWTAYRSKRVKRVPRCGGVFYSRQVILTSAGCCDRAASNGGLFAGCVARGRWRQTQWLTQHKDYEMHPHPGWAKSHSREKDDDICIIVLKKGLEESLARNDVEGISIRDAEGFSDGNATYQTWPMSALKSSTASQILNENEEYPGIGSSKVEVEVRLQNPECEIRVTHALGVHPPKSVKTARSNTEHRLGTGHGRKYLCAGRRNGAGTSPRSGDMGGAIGFHDESVEGSALVCTGLTGNKFLCGIRNSWEVRIPGAQSAVNDIIFRAKKFPTPPLLIRKSGNSKSGTGNGTTPEVPPTPVTVMPVPTPLPQGESMLWTFIRPEYYANWITKIAGPQKVRNQFRQDRSSASWDNEPGREPIINLDPLNARWSQFSA